MRRFPADLRQVLTPAIEAGRAALGELETDRVPAPLRRVVSHSGGRLPPPLAISLLQALDETEWLRELAAAELPAGGGESASAAFLRRDGGWWAVIAAAVASSRAAAAEVRSAQADARARRAAERLDEARGRLQRAGEQLEAERARSREQRAPERQSAVDTAALAEAQSRVEVLEAQLDAAVRDRLDAESMVARMRSRVVSVRRQQRREERRGGAGSALGEGPLDTAKKLDLMMAAAPHLPAGRPEPTGSVPEGPEPLELPAGVRPDAREAIDWLASLDTPVTVVVDGYNVLRNFEAGAFTSGRTRDRLAQDLARLRRRSGTARVVVVYDSGVPGPRDPIIVPGGVESRFSAKEDLADDEIVNLVSGARGGIVVITSDRDLRERCEALGALTLWSEALTGWMAR